MENQAFEEEARVEETYNPRIEETSDNHVYEDILPGTEVPTDLSKVSDEVPSAFRRNLTLPFRRAVGPEPVATSSSVRVNRRRNEAEESDDVQAECRPNRRRRKKDCKHCRNKANDDREKNRPYTTELNGRRLDNLSDVPEDATVEGSNVFTISEKVQNESKLIEYEKNNGQDVGSKDDGAEKKTRAGMRVNSIYSQDRWYAKETPIFFTDVKEQAPFQRAYSLPLRTQTPSSQNRINLRRSVRGEPPPHPARLRKHRHGWTLHLARPLETPGCTRSLWFLLGLIVTLLGIGAFALYIAFEPEKLQIIQQYLKSSKNESKLLAGTFLPAITQPNNVTTAGILTSLLPSDDQNSTLSELQTETEATVNSTRYCDDCLTEEVCVALADEEVPICRVSLDPNDPTGCAGFCLVNKQKCHRLDVDAFRCVDIEHYCLDDEWTCSNTLCIPVDKRCDGHMNCYDHSDEYNCVCDLETHFQCGNETSCLPLEKRCDGKIDCWDAADEINCTLACPSENEFTCSNGQCILKARFCDGLPDCLDGSDEPHGCQGRCNKHEFTCQNSRCIAKGMKCNGVDDCGDGSDERHCKDRIS
ncbi:uncharacterized protein LOC100882646 isoform X2 [Megachile rotundata]|uniref:uncharacterized protein LOC100882646 isoform X2 n=1 Tax=Megachile rotundata TaxID=143995 RepID=UPI000258D3F1|nr:PREDICTED: uncharacterized protein LOC100882865 isoform X2 [Megachile rotundata]